MHNEICIRVYLPKCDGWFTTFKGKSLIELGRQITKCQKANHKYRVSKEKKKLRDKQKQKVYTWENSQSWMTKKLSIPRSM